VDSSSVRASSGREERVAKSAMLRLCSVALGCLLSLALGCRDASSEAAGIEIRFSHGAECEDCEPMTVRDIYGDEHTLFLPPAPDLTVRASQITGAEWSLTESQVVPSGRTWNLLLVPVRGVQDELAALRERRSRADTAVVAVAGHVVTVRAADLGGGIRLRFAEEAAFREVVAELSLRLREPVADEPSDLISEALSREVSEALRRSEELLRRTDDLVAPLHQDEEAQRVD
jgi:hypothetical protein